MLTVSSGMGIRMKPVVCAQTRIDKAHYQTSTTIDGHTVISDEPPEKGGADTGVNPHGLLLAGLGSCTAITLRMYIDRKMWLVDEIAVNLELFKTEDGYLIEMQVSFQGELNDDQRKRLIQIADACPIHKMLTGNINITTALR